MHNSHESVRRHIGRMVLLRLGLDAALCGGLASAFAPAGEKMWWAGALFLGLEGAALALSLKGMAWNWLGYALFGRKFLVRSIYDGLVARRFPRPDRPETSAEGYLAGLVDDDSLPLETRVAAASELSSYRTQMGSGGMSMGVQLSLAFDEALERYRQK